MNYPYYNLFNQHVKQLKVGSAGQATGLCQIHNDTNPSFSVDLNTGLWTCHTCTPEGGNAITFVRAMNIDIQKTLVCENNSNLLTEKHLESVQKYSDYLLSNIERLKKSGQIPSFWNIDVLKRTKTGFDPDKKCLTFTHYNSGGNPVNIKWHNKNEGKEISQTPGHGKNRLYPLHLIQEYSATDLLIYCEGEKDCISLLSMGFNAVTHTCGAESIPGDITPLQQFEKIYTVFDNDPSGYNGAEKLAKTLKNTFPEQKVYTYDWHINTIKGFDITDYFTQGGVGRGFKHMMDYATLFQTHLIENESFIKLYRKTIHSKVFADPYIYKQWNWCMLKASHKRTFVNAKCGRGFKQIPLDMGQFLYNPTKAELELKQPKSTIKGRFKKLENWGNIKIDKKEGRTIITICKWKLYQ